MSPLRSACVCLLLTVLSPLPAAAGPLPPALRAFLRDRLDLGAYRAAGVDLDRDGAREFVVYADDPDFCGTGGCTLFVVSCRKADCRVLMDTPAVRPPVRVLDTETDGWRDLSAIRAGGGLYEPRTVRLRLPAPGREDEPPETVEPDGPGARGSVVIR